MLRDELCMLQQGLTWKDIPADTKTHSYVTRFQSNLCITSVFLRKHWCILVGIVIFHSVCYLYCSLAHLKFEVCSH